MQKDFTGFINTLKSSIKTWDYFVNWQKVFNNRAEVEIALNKLNYLIGKADLKLAFNTLYQSNPDIIKTFPILLAVRENKLELLDTLTEQTMFFDFAGATKGADKYFLFLEKSGLIQLFHKNGVKNLVDYVTGVEVGLDSNGRKNRGGKTMEQLVKPFIIAFCEKNGFEYLVQAQIETIKEKWGTQINFDKTKRRFDFAIYNPRNKKIKLLETNFYGGGGSKLKAVCGEFKNLYDVLKKQNIDFVWITDGLGWRTTTKPLEEAYNHIEHILNLHLLASDALQKLPW